MRSFSWLLLVLLLAGCGSCDEGSDNGSNSATDAGPPNAETPDTENGDVATDMGSTASCPVAPFEGAVGDWTVVVESDGSWTVSAGDSGPTLIGLPSCGDEVPLRLGRGEPTVREAFGNFDIDVSMIEWEEVSGPLAVEQQGDSVALRWPASEATLTFAPSEHGGLEVALTGPEGATAGEIGWRCDDEGYFGLGTQVTAMNLRGRTYPMWVQEQGNGKNETGSGFPISNTLEAAYAPMGVLHGSNGIALVLGHDAYSEFDLCNMNDPVAGDDAARLRSYPEQPSFVLVPGATPAERMAGVTDYTGRLPSRPPPWVFGFWVNAVEGPERVEDVASRMRAEGVPVSAIWSEDWAGSAPTQTGFRLTYEWTWDPGTYPDLPATIDDLNARGYALLGYFNPFVPDTVSHYDEGVAEGYLIEDANGDLISFPDPAFRNATLIDLSKPDAVDWLQGFQRTAIADVGLDGWMADFAEWWPLTAVPQAADAWHFHNRYPLAWQRANRGSFEAEGVDEWVYFARSGWASVNGGTSGIAPTMWGGDQDTDWERDDGFPTIAPIGAHVGLAGVAIFGSDIAGYSSLASDNTSKELFFRWLSAGALHPLMRTHHGGDNCENWTFDQDAETIAHVRRWSSIHTLLYPYLDARLTEAMNAGLPITRHPYLVAPDEPWMWNDDYDYVWFLGDDILVAPVFEEGATSRVVPFPEEGYWPLLGREPVTVTQNGDALQSTASAPATELPVFVRPGAALVLLGDVVDTHFGATTPGVTDLDDVADQYRVALYPNAIGVVGTNDQMTIVGANFSPATSFANATWEATQLPDCSPDPEASCREEDRVRLFGVTTGELTADGATLTVSADRPVDVELAIGGAAFGDLADVPPAPDLDAMPPTWCERLGFE